MRDRSLSFEPKALGNRRIDSLLPAMRVQQEPSRRYLRRYLDSFDWRVHGRGGVVMEEQMDRGLTLGWWDLDRQQWRCRQSIPRPVSFPWDLPAGALRDALQPVLEMRALLPVAVVETQVRPFHILDDDDKTVVRLTLERTRVLDPSSGKTRGSRRALVLTPVRGYPGPFREARRQLEEALGTPYPVADPYLHALEFSTRAPGDYSSKLDYTLRPEDRADVSARVILLNLLRTMQPNVWGIQRNIDSEFLHDFRVAVRRTRSALSQIPGVFPTRTMDRYKREFSWLGQITGPARDMDVYLLAFDDYKGSLPTTMQKHLEPVRGFLHAHQADEYLKLGKALTSARYRSLVGTWQRFLEQPPARRPTAVNALKPTIEVADRRIWRMFKRVLKEGAAIDHDSPDTDLHELRKSCKKLRYLMEFFCSLYPKKKIAQPIKTLKQFQENLGEFQDLSVQQEHLHSFGERMLEEGEVTQRTLQALEFLVHNLEARKHQVREAFYQRFHDFSRRDNRLHFKELFASTHPARNPAP